MTLSRRLFLGHASLVSAYAFSKSTPSAAREILSHLLADTTHLNAAHWKTFGRIVLQQLAHGVSIQDGFIIHDENKHDCEFSFSARTPPGVDEVQIWAGIRCRDRDSRYVFGLRGGNNNHIYLARYAPDGQSRFLGFAPLDFEPVPGKWYDLRAVATGNRFLIYVNNEDLPRLNVVDDAPAWHEGGVSLGGGWLPAEFCNVTVSEISADKPYRDQDEHVWQAPSVNKAHLRSVQRSAYRPLTLAALGDARTEFSLDGAWLFLPDQEIVSGVDPHAEHVDDGSWHVLDVPNLWTPTLTWLHGETGFPELHGISQTKGMSDRLWEEEIKRLDSYTFDWRKTGGGWYRQYLDVSAPVDGHRFELCFDAIAKTADVWVNGAAVGSHAGMFGPARFDVTQQIRRGQNIIAVYVTGGTKPHSSNDVVGVAVTVEVTQQMLQSLPHGMYPVDAAGMWQPVRLVVTRPIWIEDVYIKTRLNGLDFELTVQSRERHAEGLTVSYRILSMADESVLWEVAEPQALAIDDIRQTIDVSTPDLKPRLWSPAHPNLYRLEVTLHGANAVLDHRSFRFGFRTFEVHDGRLLLNGNPFWLRGANHFPHALRPNDSALAKRFLRQARDGNVAVTRSHTAPFTETWLNAADEIGMAVSYEGTWPWLMLEGPLPSDDLLKVWSEEFLSLLRRHRNHPSIILWTVNNEMKFENFDRSKPELLRAKWEILSRTVKAMRAVDPTRPVVCDSSYTRKSIGSEYEEVVAAHGFDDGDIDDSHRYPTWYEPSFFHYFQGEFGKGNSCPGRPLISQEMATGYPRNDDGHACRFYLFKHYTPQSLVGPEAYESRNPAVFLKRQAFITKELAEAIRRTNRDNCSGILHFAYVTWFRDAWNEKSIRPFPAYDALKLALQPVLVSAELFGRHFYAGSRQTVRVCIANDADDSQSLGAGELEWRIENGKQVVGSGVVHSELVPYYSNQWREIQIDVPDLPSGMRVDATLRFLLKCDGLVRSENSYDVVIAAQSWASQPRTSRSPASQVPLRHGVIVDAAGDIPQPLLALGARRAASWAHLVANDLAVVVDGARSLSDSKIEDALRSHVSRGGNVLVFQGADQMPRLFPDHVRSYRTVPGEIAAMRVPESPIFSGIEQLDLAWWATAENGLPRVCHGTHQVVTGSEGLEVYSEVVDIHGYLKQPSDFLKVSGSPLWEVRIGDGRWMSCELTLLSSSQTDPIAGRLLANLLRELSQ